MRQHRPLCSRGPTAPEAEARTCPARRSRGHEPRDGSLGGVFDHVAIAVSDLAASERFYRTVLSMLGVEPSHADAELMMEDTAPPAP